MTRYLLDTHAIVWLLENSSKLDTEVREEISLCEGNFAYSDISMFEIAQLQALGKISLNRSIARIEEELRELAIGVFVFDTEMLDRMRDLPVVTLNGDRHTDPFDRYIIATAIRSKCTVVSRDARFPAYRKYGLTLRTC